MSFKFVNIIPFDGREGIVSTSNRIDEVENTKIIYPQAHFTVEQRMRFLSNEEW